MGVRGDYEKSQGWWMVSPRSGDYEKSHRWWMVNPRHQGRGSAQGVWSRDRLGGGEGDASVTKLVVAYLLTDLIDRIGDSANQHGIYAFS